MKYNMSMMKPGDKVRIIPEEIHDWGGPPTNTIIGDDGTGWYTVSLVGDTAFKTEELRGSEEYHWSIHRTSPAIKEFLPRKVWEERFAIKPDDKDMTTFLSGF